MVVAGLTGVAAWKLYRYQWKCYKIEKLRYKWTVKHGRWNEFAEDVQKILEKKLGLPCEIVTTQSGHEVRTVGGDSIPWQISRYFSIERLAYGGKDKPDGKSPEEVANEAAILYMSFSGQSKTIEINENGNIINAE